MIVVALQNLWCWICIYLKPYYINNNHFLMFKSELLPTYWFKSLYAKSCGSSFYYCNNGLLNVLSKKRIQNSCHLCFSSSYIRGREINKLSFEYTSMYSSWFMTSRYKTLAVSYVFRSIKILVRMKGNPFFFSSLFTIENSRSYIILFFTISSVNNY